MNPLAESRLLGGVEHALHRVRGGERGHVAPARGEEERRGFDGSPSQQDTGMGSHCLYRAYNQIIGAQTPVLRASKLFDQLDATLAPRDIRRQAEPLEDDLVHLVHEEQLGECELLLCREGSHRLVTDREEDGPWHRLLVILDLSLEV